MATIDWRTFRKDQLICSAPKFNKKGGQNVTPMAKLDNGTTVPIRYKVPEMRTPFGTSCYDDTLEHPKWTISSSMDGYDDTTSEIYRFAKFLQLMDEAIVDLAFNNSQLWFKKQHSREFMEEVYKPLFRVPKPGSSYAPTYRGSLRSFKKDIKTPCFNQNHERVDIRENVIPGGQVRRLDELSQIWFMDKTFGPQASIMQVFAKPIELFNVCMLDDDDDDDDATGSDENDSDNGAKERSAVKCVL